MCTYNGERYLREQLESIARQDRLPAELVVSDDCSTDGTMDLLSDFSRGAPFPMIVLRNPANLGSTANFERAIRRCQGDFIALCDQDDVWMRSKLQRSASMLEEHPSLGGVFSDAELIEDSSTGLGRLLSDVNPAPEGGAEGIPRMRLIRALVQRSVVTGATLMIRAAVRDIVLPIPKLWVHDAWIAWMLALHHGLGRIEEPLVQYRIHGQQQLGIGARSILDRIRIARRAGRGHHRLVAEQFEFLRERWKEVPGENYDEVLALLNGKIAFFRRRECLSGNPVRRGAQMLFMMRDYRRYARGLRSFRKDAIL